MRIKKKKEFAVENCLEMDSLSPMAWHKGNTWQETVSKVTVVQVFGWYILGPAKLIIHTLHIESHQGRP